MSHHHLHALVGAPKEVQMGGVTQSGFNEIEVYDAI